MMSPLSILLLIFAVIRNDFGHCFTTQDMEITTPAFEPGAESEEHQSLFSAEKINKAIDNLEKISSSADMSYRGGIIPMGDIEKMYDEINTNFIDMIGMLENPNNAYEFLKAKGLDRIVITNIGTPYTPLRNTILVLLKNLFNIAPSTTNAMMPARMIDKVLDIFLDDDDSVLKSNVVDILHIWLPENPRAQARVMKVKGLVPFYEQMSKLDGQGLLALLDFFNKILQEHLDVRYKKQQRNKQDAEELKLYQRIGLLEHMARKDVCGGLFRIVRDKWESRTPTNDMTWLLIDLSTKIGPLCLKVYKGKPQVEELYDEFLQYLKKENREEYFSKFGMDASSIETLITNYIDSLKQANELKDEF